MNNAWGGGSLGRVEHKTNEQMAHGLQVGCLGLSGPCRLSCRRCAPQGRGNIINLCSLNGVNAHIGTGSTTAPRRRCARSPALPPGVGTYGVVANAICPAAKTAASRAVFAANPELEALADAANPMGRLGDPETDIAPVAVFLASDDARYLTGNTLFVDGGSHINGAPWAPELPDRP